ncbi:YMGG-like glycine zipper-containing protein [Sulfurovum sp. zt1-1]|uniref:YMGG-like glycine zipper-containing protein n=1 Tax=Sulfurovum zhangzhouensis TaxID=3019067 RepID=A0ABT7QW92_9BACT|nr:YMGG-like glycine zipper-containing protein [Sulfurovum zhangzhouensis]MDM5271057.1 YMGG-like glycine zipper-containing protein [Sulfurovum zhangzhouensis]
MKRIDIKKVSLAFVLGLMMIGCAEPSPNTKKGALVGAASGAVVSGVTGGNVVKGAAVGAVVGGTVGYISDQ